MATPEEALNNMLEDTVYEGWSGYKKKSDRVQRNEKQLLIKQLLKFLEEVDEGLSVMELRQALEEM